MTDTIRNPLAYIKHPVELVKVLTKAATPLLLIGQLPAVGATARDGYLRASGPSPTLAPAGAPGLAPAPQLPAGPAASLVNGYCAIDAAHNANWVTGCLRYPRRDTRPNSVRPDAGPRGIEDWAIYKTPPWELAVVVPFLVDGASASSNTWVAYTRLSPAPAGPQADPEEENSGELFDHYCQKLSANVEKGCVKPVNMCTY